MPIFTMSTELETSLNLLVVGMTTVFLILSIVVLSSKFLISLINRFEPAIIPDTTKKKASIPQEVELVISKTVHQITGGKGKIEKIEKID